MCLVMGIQCIPHALYGEEGDGKPKVNVRVIVHGRQITYQGGGGQYPLAV